jgi:hypothetical protein
MQRAPHVGGWARAYCSRAKSPLGKNQRKDKTDVHSNQKEGWQEQPRGEGQVGCSRQGTLEEGQSGGQEIVVASSRHWGRALKNKAQQALKAKSDAEVFRLIRQSRRLHPKRRLRRAITSTGARKMPDWTLHEEALLGTMSDGEVAKKIGRTKVAVTLHRQRMGILSLYRAKRWTKNEIAVLGTLPDRLVAKKLDRTLIAVTGKRSQLLIPNIVEKVHRWHPKEDALLGRKPDKEVARSLGVTISAVQHRRRALGIYLGAPAPRHQWNDKEEVLLGTMTDKALARKLKCSVMVVSYRRKKFKIRAFRPWWSPAQDLLVRRLSDKEAARRLGKTVLAVRKRRRKLGLARK